MSDKITDEKRRKRLKKRLKHYRKDRPETHTKAVRAALRLARHSFACGAVKRGLRQYLVAWHIAPNLLSDQQFLKMTHLLARYNKDSKIAASVERFLRERGH
jgi:FPC/CPF motif-containing protein YcgG